MIRRWMVMLIVPLLWASLGHAAQTRFQGVFQVTDQRGDCQGEDWVGFRLVARFQPPITQDNGPGSKLTLFDYNLAYGFRLNRGFFTNRFKAVDSMSIGGNFQPNENQARVRFTRTDPETYSTSTLFIRITGEIENFDDLLGCVVAFNLNLTQRVE